MKTQLDDIKNENQAELNKIKGELVETLETKTQQGVESNKNSGKDLMKQIEGVMKDMNKTVEKQTDQHIDQLKKQVNDKTGEILQIVKKI